MNHETIYTDGCDDVKVVFDKDDTDLPFGISAEYSSDRIWFDFNAVHACLAKLPGGGAPAVNAANVSFNEGLLRLAAVHGKVVHFRYAKGDGTVIELRSLRPDSVTEVGGHVIFTGLDPDRDEPRSYRVDRMKGEVTVA